MTFASPIGSWSRRAGRPRSSSGSVGAEVGRRSVDPRARCHHGHHDAGGAMISTYCDFADSPTELGELDHRQRVRQRTLVPAVRGRRRTVLRSASSSGCCRLWRHSCSGQRGITVSPVMLIAAAWSRHDRVEPATVFRSSTLGAYPCAPQQHDDVTNAASPSSVTTRELQLGSDRRVRRDCGFTAWGETCASAPVFRLAKASSATLEYAHTDVGEQRTQRFPHRGPGVGDSTSAPHE